MDPARLPLQYFPFFFCIVLSIITESSCTPFQYASDDLKISTESPDVVEVFDPQSLYAAHGNGQQMKINYLTVETKVRLRYARTRIMINLDNPLDKNMQATFKIILPEDSLFTIFKLRKAGRDGKTYTATINKTDDARNLFHYAYATNDSITAGFIQLFNENDLTNYLLKFAITPGTRITAYLVCETQIIRTSGIYSHKIHIYPLDDSISTISNVKVTVDVEELEDIKHLHLSSQSKDLNPTTLQRYSSKRQLISWEKYNATSNFLKERPFEFEYELVHYNTSSAVVITQSNGNIYFVHLFVPEALPVIPKHVIFVLDISDSMHGPKLEQLKWAMIEILDDLESQDFFSIITFSNDISVWSKFMGDRSNCHTPYPATLAIKKDAITFIRNVEAHGTTNMYLGLRAALEIVQFTSHKLPNLTCKTVIRTPEALRKKSPYPSKLPENVEPMMFFLSDGKSTTGPQDPRILLHWFTEVNHSKLPKPVPVYTIAFGDDADISFLRELANENGGLTKFIPHDSLADIEVANFYAGISSPVLTQVQTSVVFTNFHEEQQQRNFSSALVLIQGTEVITAGELFVGSKNQIGNNWMASNIVARTEAYNGKQKLIYESPVYDCRTLNETFDNCLQKIDLFLERLQAYQRLKRFMELDKKVQDKLFCPKKPGDGDEYIYYSSFYNYDDYNYEDEECVNPYINKVTELALKHGFVTPYTSFILVSESKIDKGLKGVAQMNPVIVKHEIGSASKIEEVVEENVLPQISNKLIYSRDYVDFNILPKIEISGNSITNLNSQNNEQVQLAESFMKNASRLASQWYKRILITKSLDKNNNSTVPIDNAMNETVTNSSSNSSLGVD